MRAIFAAALLVLASSARALITVNEGLPTTKDAVYIGTTTPQLLLNGGTFYAGLVPSVSLYVASNTVLGNCVAYATGSITCLGVRLSTTDPASLYVPYTGATADVNIGTHKMLAAQFGAGTSPSTNFLFDGLGSSSGFIRVGAAINLATGYYWGGTRGYSLQERYDLGPTPFTLHDELNNVDRFSLDTSGGWYFPGEITTSTLTVQGNAFSVGGSSFTVSAGSATVGYNLNVGSFGDSGSSTFIGSMTAKGAINGVGIATGAAIAASLYGDGNNGTPLGVLSSSAVVRESNLGIRIASATLTGTGNGLFDLTISSGLQFLTTKTGIVWADGSTSTSAAGGAGPPGPAGPAGSPAGTLGYVRDNFLNLVTGSQKTFTLTYTPSANSEQINLDGTILSGTSDYTLAANVITMTTAPAIACTGGAPSNCTSAFFVQYATGATGVNAFILGSTQQVTGATTFYGLVNIAGTSNISWLFASSQTFTAVTSIAVGLPASTNLHYQCDLEMTQNTNTGFVTGYFNNDQTAGHYKRGIVGNNPAGAITTVSNSDTKFMVSDGGNGVLSGQNLSAWLDIPTNGATTSMHGTSSWTDVNSNYSVVTLSASYATAAATTLYFATSAGTMTGTIQCQRN